MHNAQLLAKSLRHLTKIKINTNTVRPSAFMPYGIPSDNLKNPSANRIKYIISLDLTWPTIHKNL